MKKILPLLITAALLCTGCQSKSNTESTSGSTTSATEPSTAEDDEAPADSQSTQEDETPSESEDIRFMTGTWLIKQDDIQIGYMFTFDANEKLGMVYTYDTGVEQEFSYNIGVNEIAFTSGSDTVTVEITDGDLSIFGILTPEGEKYSISYFSDSMPDEILGNFYSNPKLCEIALDYYEKNNGSRPTSCDATNNADGTVSLHLYDNMDDHITTVARYTVDRTSCVGTDDILLTDINILE